jgi:hypothetical protein
MTLALALALFASPAQAVTCYGDYCSGKDPVATGCSADARTVASNVTVYGGAYRYVQLRWSPTCKTNWTRVNYVTPKYLWATQEPTKYTQWYSNHNATYSWTRQIYSPSKCVRGGVRYPNNELSTTACV